MLDDARGDQPAHVAASGSARWSAARRTATPALLAKITSNIDVISGGRLDWGIGAGWYEHEFNGYGYEFPAAKDRIGDAARDRRDREGDVDASPTSTYEGKYFQLQGAQCDPKPVQQPHPPIWIGGGGEQLTLRVVARHADRSNFGGKPHEFAHKCEVLKGHCKAVGRDYDEIAQDVVARGVHPRDRAGDRRRRHRSRSGASRSSRGAPATSSARRSRCAEKIQTYVDLGCTGFVPWCSRLPRDRVAAPASPRRSFPNFR